uniref:SPT2 chromatin n=1 Tax=Toxoplasma gondii COUG TaxID=1074873 RepID=A0A2G8Y2U6_TOXGO|nr:SPT2 chromatin [Toxoplasma gondii COUG]
MDRLDELLLPERNFLVQKPITSPLESRLRRDRDSAFSRNRTERTAPARADVSVEKRRREERKREEEAIDKWRADRKRELVVFLRRANRELLSGPEVNKAIAQFKALTESPETVLPPADVLQSLSRERLKTQSPYELPPEQKPTPIPAGPLTASQRLSLQLRERGAQLARLREREEERRLEEEHRVGEPRRPRAGSGGVRRAHSFLRGVNTVRAGPLRVPGRMSFEESRRKAQRHGVVVTKTRPKATKDETDTPGTGEDASDSVGTGVNGISKPVKRWVNGKVIVEKWSGSSSLVYLSQRSSGPKEEPAHAGASVPSAGRPDWAVAAASTSCRDKSEQSETQKVKEVDPPLSARGTGQSQRPQRQSDPSSHSPRPACLPRDTAVEIPDRRTCTDSRGKRPRSPGPFGVREASGEPRHTSQPHGSPLNERGFRKLPGSRIWSPAKTSGGKSQEKLPAARETASSPNSVWSPVTAARSAASSGVPKAHASREKHGSAHPGEACCRPRAFWAPSLTPTGSRGSVSRAPESKNALAAGKARAQFVVPDVLGRKPPAAAPTPKRYICGVPQPDRSACVRGSGIASGLPGLRTLGGGRGVRPSLPTCVSAQNSGLSTEKTRDLCAKTGGAPSGQSVWRAPLHLERRELEARHRGADREGGEREEFDDADPARLPCTGLFNRPSRPEWRASERGSWDSPEEDDDLDDFIVEDEEAGEAASNWQAEMRRVTGYDPRNFAGRFEGECAESGFHQQLQEEQYSGQIGAQEDAEEYAKLLEEAREERRLEKRRSRQG